MLSTIPSRCPVCNEQIVRFGDTDRIVHRYNVKEECPNGKGKIPVFRVPGGDYKGKKFDGLEIKDIYVDELSDDEVCEGEEDGEGDDGEGDDAEDAEADAEYQRRRRREF